MRRIMNEIRSSPASPKTDDFSLYLGESNPLGVLLYLALVATSEILRYTTWPGIMVLLDPLQAVEVLSHAGVRS